MEERKARHRPFKRTMMMVEAGAEAEDVVEVEEEAAEEAEVEGRADVAEASKEVYRNSFQRHLV
jgi:hypothetical protein